MCLHGHAWFAGPVLDIVLAASGVMAASSGAPAASAGPAADDEAIEFSYFMVSDKLLQYACPSGGRK